ncbi:MAG TPA: hypothetical protein G4O11_05260 [Anaerolineae bacterium]|nr:hypothetical protein [Anaerolineae bacterium]
MNPSFLAQGIPGMGWQFIVACLVLVLSGLFLLIFPLVRVLRSRVRRLPVPRWLLSWLVGIGLSLITVILVDVLRSSLFIRFLFKYYRGWSPLLPINILSPLGMLLVFDLATILLGLIVYGILSAIRLRRA